MIEMHQGDEPSEEALGVDVDHTTRRRVTKIGRIASSSAALAIASLVIALATLGTVHMADVIGETRLLGSHSRHVSDLTDIRAIALIQMIVAAIGLVLALLSIIRVREGAEVDGDAPPRDPDWVHGIAGAALIASVLSAALAAIALAYALTATAGSPFGFAG